MKEGLFLQSAALSYRANNSSLADARSTISREREMNGDVAYEYSGQAKNGQCIGLYVVCDGFGGHQNGKAASHLAVQMTVDALLPILHEGEAPVYSENRVPVPTILNQSVKAAIRDANEEIWRLIRSGPRTIRTMGTALTLAAVAGNLAYVANVGHGRVYVWRAGKVRQLTQDHSVAVLLAKSGHISERPSIAWGEIAGHPQRKTLLRSLGQKEEVAVDLFKGWLQAGDRLLLCSDGLWNAFSNRNELAEYMGAASTPAEICHQMVAEARKRDGSDDISAVVVTISDAALHRAHRVDPRHPRVQRLTHQALWRILQEEPFLAYKDETDHLYYVRNGQDLTLSVPKNRTAPEPYPPPKPLPLTSAWHALGWAMLGLSLAGIGALAFAPVALFRALDVLLNQPLNRAYGVRAVIVVILSVLLWGLGVGLGLLLLLHLANINKIFQIK